MCSPRVKYNPELLFSGMKTVLPTGPGAWELKDRGITRPKATKTKAVLQAIPSITHMAIVQLHREGLVKFVVSQNVDGLHMRSGLHSEAIAELHGNTNLEICEKCGARYLRDFRTRNARRVHNHYTGRLCEVVKCKGKLLDSIINFGEDLPDKELSNAFLHAEKADLCICLGSSLRVSPANEIPRLVATAGKRVAIGNLQKTPLDKTVAMVIHAMCDDIMTGLMQRLKIAIPKWELNRRVRLSIKTSNTANGKLKLKFSVTGLGIDNDVPYSIFQKVSSKIAFEGKKITSEMTNEPFSVAKVLEVKDRNSFKISVSLELFFHGHYGEPPFTLKEKVCDAQNTLERDYLLFYDPAERKWRVGSQT